MALARAFHYRIESLPDKWMIYRQTLNYKTLQQYTDSIIISRTLSNQTNEGLFKCDFDALYLELTKLALHAELHPDQKIIWLGSARSVMAVIDEKDEWGTYLNCDDTKWTWHLNRLYLIAYLFQVDYNLVRKIIRRFRK